jgi:hypothetical protein
MIAVQRVSQALPFAPAAGPQADYAEHWLILEDDFYAGSAIPPLYVQVQYDPAKLSPELSAAPLSLYRVSGDLLEVPSIVDPVAHTVTTRDPVDFSAWTLGRATPPPTLAATPPSAGKVTIAWPATAAGFELFATTEFKPDTTWAPVNATVTTNGELKSVTIDAGPGSRFFRLAK